MNNARRRSICLFIGEAIMTLCIGSRALAQADQILPPLGGPGGGQFVARCQLGEILNGLELRTGDDVDGIRPICLAANSANVAASRRAFATGFGGPGAGVVALLCQDTAPAVIGLFVASEGADSQIVNNIHLYCGQVAPGLKPTGYPAAVFDGPGYTAPPHPFFLIGQSVQRQSGDQSCPDNLVAVGINGRSGIWLDALGLICGAAPANPRPVISSIGRVGRPSTPGPARPICEVARESRARNSPNAPRLEAMCEASKPTVSSIGRVGGPSTPGPARPICEVARESRERNSPNAARLEAMCRSADLQAQPDLATSGLLIAQQDPLAMALRGQQTEGPGQRGFDIGMAAAEGQTAPGPGKQRIHDALPPAEQRGFEAAVAFSLERNRNAQFAAAGAIIARADPAVAAAHNVESDVFYWLGFDIASAIFGDLALGALGDTEMNDEHTRILNGLSPAGQRGFTASMQYHLSRDYARSLSIAVNPAIADTDVVISQVYGGGGSADSSFVSDFIELLNRGTSAVNLSGWSIQYASSGGPGWQVAPLTGTIAPGGYFLIHNSNGAGAGNPLPNANVRSLPSLAAKAGKIALVRNNATLIGFCPASAYMVDFVGYGAANCSEGGAPVAQLGNQTAAVRNAAGCSDTNANATDFEVAAPQPRNQAAGAANCER